MTPRNDTKSALIQDDPLSDQTYKQNNWDPATATENMSYTSSRAGKRVYNKYGPTSNSTQVFGYYTDWSQYDGRLDGDFKNAGRGTDLMLLDPGLKGHVPYDRLIVGFAGILDADDKSDKQKAIIQPAAAKFGRQTQNWATFTDPWGDVASYRNVGFSKYNGEDYPKLFRQDAAQGMLGGLAKLKKANPNLKLAFSVGGWTMSWAFYDVAHKPERIDALVASIADIFQRFPMFTEVDLDWEYPGQKGDGHPFDKDDAKKFQDLVRTLKKELPKVRVSIAAGATKEILDTADIPGMIAAGVEGVNLMTYDFFGTPWAKGLAHHTNLYPTGNSDYSIDDAVQYLLGKGVASTNIFIGYAAYSRNARGAVIESSSPLKGTYQPGSGTTTGTFESGASEYYDILYNYLDLEHRSGRNGFDVYTDDKAHADFLYNPTSKLFLSIDTPRSVKEKGQYVIEKKLGGLFTWTIDMDNGVLLNAAREGLGAAPQKPVTVDMTPFYFKGKVPAGTGRR